PSCPSLSHPSTQRHTTLYTRYTYSLYLSLCLSISLCLSSLLPSSIKEANLQSCVSPLSFFFSLSLSPSLSLSLPSPVL
ncbi:hypothetical protein BKA57DRAFT_537622, partial [Linnemannia elongata]